MKTSEEMKKIFEKIQKCLRLSASSNPHEAAAALRQAQKLMDMHGISEADIKAIGYSHVKVEVPIQVNKKVTPEHLVAFVNLVRRAFGVKCIYTRNRRISDVSYMIHYFGPSHRVQMAAYAHTVMFRAMNGAWALYLKNNPGAKGERGARTSFFLGWVHGVSEKVEAIGFPAEEQAATDLVVNREYDKLKDIAIGRNKLDDELAWAGIKASRKFEINRPMDQDKLRLT